MNRAIPLLLLTACVVEPVEAPELGTTEQALNGDTWINSDLLRPPSDETKVLYDAAFSSTHRLYVVGSTNTRWVFRTSTNGGITYSSGPTFYFPGGGQARAQKIALDASDRILVVGGAVDAFQRSHILARLSTDHGVTFRTVDQITYPSFAIESVTALTVDSDGKFTYVITPSAGDSAEHSLIRQSRPGGTSWSTIPNPAHTKIRGLCESDSGLIGTGRSETSPNVAVTYRLSSGSWTQIGSFTSSAGDVANGLVCLATGNTLYVGGHRNGDWIMRRSTDNGATWSTVDTVDTVEPGSVRIHEMGLGRSGRVYVVGMVDGAWIVRRTSNGTSWLASDFSEPELGFHEAYGYAFDPVTEDITVVGTDDNKDVRRLAH